MYFTASTTLVGDCSGEPTRLRSSHIQCHSIHSLRLSSSIHAIKTGRRNAFRQGNNFATTALGGKSRPEHVLGIARAVRRGAALVSYVKTRTTGYRKSKSRACVWTTNKACLCLTCPGLAAFEGTGFLQRIIDVDSPVRFLRPPSGLLQPV